MTTAFFSITTSLRDLSLPLLLSCLSLLFIKIQYQQSKKRESDLQENLKLSDDFLGVQKTVDASPLLSQNKRGKDSSVGIGRAWCLLTRPQNGNILLVLLTGFQPEIWGKSTATEWAVNMSGNVRAMNQLTHFYLASSCEKGWKDKALVLKFLTIAEQSQEQCKTFLDLRGSNTPDLESPPCMSRTGWLSWRTKCLIVSWHVTAI